MLIPRYESSIWVIKMSNKYESLSVMISKQMKIFTDARMFLLTSLHNVWQHVAVRPLASLVVQTVMKLI